MESYISIFDKNGSTVDDKLKQKLINLAQKYEVHDFVLQDPSQFLFWYDDFPEFKNICNVECAAFVAAMLSFGNRKQFIPKIREILEYSLDEGGIARWCLNGAKKFPAGTQKFYRFYSYDDLHTLFDEMAEILKESDSLGEHFRKIYQNDDKIPLHRIVSLCFPKSAIVPKGKNSANKRINMFLRWMVRQNSPVDLGIWTWASPKELIIPLDVHVMQQAIKLNLLPENASASLKTAQTLTAKLSEVFPDDPVRADYALFGLGISS